MQGERRTVGGEMLLEGHAVVADFGIARALDAGAERMTATGIVIGTPTYMSPEQASGDQSLDGRSDPYARRVSPDPGDGAETSASTPESWSVARRRC